MRFAQKIILTTAIFFLTVSSECTVYKQIMHQTLAATPWQEEDWPNEPFYDYLMRSISYQENMQEFKKRRTVFLMFDRAAEKQSLHFSNSVLNDQTTWNDLNLLCGCPDAAISLLSKIDRASTVFGKTMLSSLVLPTDDCDALRKRQCIVKKLIHNKALFEQLEAALEKIKNSENLLLSFWGQDPFYQTARQQRYFSFSNEKINDACNYSEAVMELRSLGGHQQRIGWAAGTLLAAIALPIYGYSIASGWQMPEALKTVAQNVRGSGSPMIGVLSSMTTNRFVQGTLAVGAGIYAALSAKESYEWMRDNFVFDDCLHRKLMHVAQAVHAMEDIWHALQQHEELDALLEYDKAAVTLFDAREGYVKDLVYRLRDPRFKEPLQKTSLKGRLLVTYKLMHECKEDFEPLLVALGTIDMYMSIAKLYKEFETKRVHYSFVDFKQADSPEIALINFWNPFVDDSVVVANDLTMSADSGQNIIITGPNAGGKSTLLKAIALNLILAQSFGIVAADSATITPFHKIMTYLNIVDDIGSGNSLFKAQVLRAQELVECVNQLKVNQFGFFVADEMFNGTSPNEAEATAYSVAKNLSYRGNIMCVLATHFPLLTTLVNANSLFRNYQVSVDRDQQGNISYRFKLEPGISQQHVAIDILKMQGFDGAILTEAQSIMAARDRKNGMLVV